MFMTLCRFVASLRWAQLPVVALPVIGLVLLPGCAPDKLEAVATASPAAATTPAKQEVPKPETAAKGGSQDGSGMVGKTRQELVARLGNPQQTMDVTLAGRPPSEAYLYPSTAEGGCTPAYVIVEDTGKIIDYFCR